MRIAKWICLPMLLLPVILAPAGCRQLMREAFKTPRVEVVEVALEADPRKGVGSPLRFLVTLEVDNPNPYPLNVAGLAWTGTVAGATVTEGEKADEIRIGPSGATTVRLPVGLRPGALEAAVRQLITKRAISWEFNGSVGLRTPVVGVVRIPFSKSGSYDLPYVLRRLGIGLN